MTVAFPYTVSHNGTCCSRWPTAFGGRRSNIVVPSPPKRTRVIPVARQKSSRRLNKPLHELPEALQPSVTNYDQISTTDTMADPGMNNLLKWSIQNTAASRNDPTSKTNPRADFDPEVMRKVLEGMTGPSDAEMMVRKMDVISSPEYSVEDKVQAFDDFEMMIENLDNANNMESLQLWSRLVDQLDHEEAELRKYAAWCIGTAIENNPRAQERVRSPACCMLSNQY
jgi:hypothetical protein